jgi:hypothetical protein
MEKPYTIVPLHENGWFIMTVNLPQNNPICLGIVSHEALKVHLGNTMLEYDCNKVLPEQGSM